MVAKRQRMHTMDMLRGSAVSLVILWHIFAIPQLYGVEMPTIVRDFFNFLSPIRIPLLFFLSGMLLPYALEKSAQDFIFGKIRNILWPWVLWTLITCIAASNIVLLKNPWIVAGGVYHLWYLSCLFVLYGIGFFARWVPLPIFLIMLPTVLYFGDISTNLIYRPLFYSVLFFSGAIFLKYRECFYNLGVWAPLTLGLLAFIAWVTVGVTDHTGGDLRFYFFSLPLIFSFLWMVNRLPRILWLENIGRHSIVWYLVHFPAIIIIYRIANFISLGYWPSIIMNAVGAFGVSYIFYRYYRQVRFLF